MTRKAGESAKEARRPRKGYHATVSVLAGERLGIYLPKEFLANMRWRRGTELRLTVLPEKKLVVEIVE